MRIGFLSDLHLNFVSKRELYSFRAKLRDQNLDAFVIAGDTAEADSLISYLTFLERGLDVPIYYVHGNHDYYKSSFEALNKASSSFSDKSKYCKHVTTSGIIKLTEKSCLIGHDGWYDCKAGSYFSSNFELADFMQIEDLSGIYTRDGLFRKFNQLGLEYAEHIGKMIPKAAEQFENIYYLTHVPPFSECALFDGNPSPSYSVGFFCCVQAGEMFLNMKELFPNKNITVLAGHSHSKANLDIDNLHVRVAGARYYKPDLFDVLEIE